MIAFEEVLVREQPDLVLVCGRRKFNNRVRASCCKNFIFLLLMSRPGYEVLIRDMPEEINRVLTDAIAEYLFVTEPSGEKNLLREGISQEKIFFVGNVMIDTLLANKSKADQSSIISALKMSSQKYVLLTLHRPQTLM
jgi:UDP-N-acetylglucosamine 2-epimerase (non-hydrolysing)